MIEIPLHIRSTETRTFNGAGCPTEWFWDRVDEAQGVSRKPKAFFKRGEAAHKFIEDVLNGVPIEAAFDDIAEWPNVDPDFEESWIETQKCTKAGIVDEVETISERWRDQYEEYYSEYDLVAAEFELDFHTPKGTWVKTTLDALFKDENGNPVVVDWKFGTSKSGKDMQLYVYWYGLRKMGIIEDDRWFRGWFHYITYNDPIGYTKSTKYPGDLFVEQYIDEAQFRRLGGPYLPNPEWFSCRYCAHQEVCPLYAEDPEEVWGFINTTPVEWAEQA